MAEAANVATIAEAVKTVDSAAVAEAFAGGMAIFAGRGSPMTHAMGIGLNGPVHEPEIERMEEFFHSRGCPCTIDLCTLADISVLAFLQRRPYRVVEFNNVMVRPVGPSEKFVTDPGIGEIGSQEYGKWSRIVCTAFSEQMPVMEEMVATMSAGCRVSRCWLGFGDRLEAGAAMNCRDGIALLYGDATLPEARGQGRQIALIQARLAAAQQSGCEFAVSCVLPGTVSHRNYERAGFQLLYMRVNLAREWSTSP